MATTDATELTNKLQTDDFIVEINGYASTFVAKLDLPKISHESIEIKGAGMDIPKYLAGSKRIDTIKMEVYVPTKGTLRTFFHEWQKLNETKDPLQYYRDMSATQMGESKNASILWTIEDAWIMELENPKLDAEKKSEAVKYVITIRCNNCYPEAK